MQSKRMSMIESVSNVLVGYLVAVWSQIIIFPMFGVNIAVRDNFMIGLWFTVISLIRSYSLRRVFNAFR